MPLPVHAGLVPHKPLRCCHPTGAGAATDTHASFLRSGQLWKLWNKPDVIRLAARRTTVITELRSSFVASLRFLSNGLCLRTAAGGTDVRAPIIASEAVVQCFTWR